MVIDKGRKNSMLLVQPQYTPMPVEEEIAVVYCGTRGLLSDVPLENVAEFEKYFLEILRSRHEKDVLSSLREGKLTPEVETILQETAQEVVKRYKK